MSCQKGRASVSVRLSRPTRPVASLCLYKGASGEDCSGARQDYARCSGCLAMHCCSSGSWYSDGNSGITARTDDRVPKLRCTSFMHCPSHDLPHYNFEFPSLSFCREGPRPCRITSTTDDHVPKPRSPSHMHCPSHDERL